MLASLHFSLLYCFLSIILFQFSVHFLRACNIACFASYWLHFCTFSSLPGFLWIIFWSIVHIFRLCIIACSISYYLNSGCFWYGFWIVSIIFINSLAHLLRAPNSACILPYCLLSCTFSYLHFFCQCSCFILKLTYLEFAILHVFLIAACILTLFQTYTCFLSVVCLIFCSLP